MPPRSSGVACAGWDEMPRPREAEAAATVHKHTKSRNGCVTCKARRRKCDEAKPSCAQCARRRVPCGGYSKDLRWKEFQQPGSAMSLVRKSRQAEKHRGTNTVARSPRSGGQDRGTHGQPTPSPSVDMLPDISIGPAEPPVDLDLLFANMHTSVDAPVPTPMSNDDEAATITSFYHLFNSSADLDSALADMSGLDALALDDRDTEWQMPFEEMPQPSSPLTLPTHPLYEQPRLHSDSPEHIAFLFHRRICKVLCIRDGAAGNPWRHIVWPLAQEHTALYHAIAAMTCFQGANRLPQFRAKGLGHLNTSIQQLYGVHGSSRSIRLEVALAVTLAQGFAQTWYYPRSSTGIRFVKSAKNMLQKALARYRPARWSPTSQPDDSTHQRNSSNSSNSDLACLRFLANTWIYMDVITRFTCRDVQRMDTRFMTACRLLDAQPHTALHVLQVDPLMGTAETLFPLIGQVADLVNRVHRMALSPMSDSEVLNLNPPGLVAEAVELKMAIERWMPPDPVDADRVCDNEDSRTGTGMAGTAEFTESDSETTTSASDLAQTANAYKWATLLLLHQAVPELPRTLSLARIARQVLVLLATVPLGSRAIIFPVLPLLIAGCEAAEHDDRTWVRHRWNALAAGNSSGIVDRCLELTLEVWRRRDHIVARKQMEHAMPHLNWDQELFFGGSPQADGGLGSTIAVPSEPIPAWPTSGILDAASLMSESLEPKPGPEPGLEQSSIAPPEYTVKSKQHWLSVMRDWGWEVMFG